MYFGLNLKNNRNMIALVKICQFGCKRLLIQQIKQLKYYSKIMRPQQQVKRIAGPYIQQTSSNKTNHSGHSLLSMRDYRKPAVSRQRQDQKIIKDRSKNKHEQKYQYSDNRTLKAYSSRQIKDNSAAKSETLVKKRQPQQLSYMNHDSSHSSHSNSNNHGISINVNIQNLITPKHAQNLQNFGLQKEEHGPLIEKNPLIVNNQDSKKPRKNLPTAPDLQCIQFECTQQLAYKKPKTHSPHVDTRFTSRQNIDPKNMSKSQKAIRTKQKPKILSIQQNLNKFSAQIDEINNNFNAQCLLYLDNRLAQYRVNPKYIQQCQPNFNWVMRSLVVEWMMQVSAQFGLKRQTFHISVNLVDRFLQKQKNLATGHFQLVGAAAMFIASKLQQFQPKRSQQFQKSTNRHSKASKIRQMQKRICIALQYKLNPPTAYRWANRLMLQWDTYLNNRLQIKQYKQFKKYQIFFKQLDNQSYLNYRLLMQLIDCSTLQIQTAIYHPKLIVCSFMYLYLGRQCQGFNNQQIYKQFPESSQYLYDETIVFNGIFNQFLYFTFGFELLDLLPTIQYCASFFSLPPSVEPPNSLKDNPEVEESMGLEEYCTFQTFDKNMIAVVKNRRRDI